MENNSFKENHIAFDAHSKKCLASYLFHEGTNFSAYEYMGAHLCDDGQIVFRVWAPNAKSVFLSGDFNNWGNSMPLKRITKEGIFEIYAPQSIFDKSDLYKYKIVTDTKEYYKADPYGFYFENPPQTATRFFDIKGFEWQDEQYLNMRKNTFDKWKSLPLNIYELHVGSFMKNKQGNSLSYTELAEELISYVKQMGYTHVELMPIMEHPFDGSWGYQLCGYYAPTSRFGNPFDFMSFVNMLHKAGIGVILDWVPAHFPKDAHGLYEFDGKPLYEYQGKDRMEYKEWGTRKFDVARNEVECFLISNASFWCEMYHADGLRIDAVASMLYLDYGKNPGEWFPNKDGTNKSYESVAFFQKLSEVFKKKHPDCMLIAEESTAWPGVTHSCDNNGLGFDYKWNMGWMNDILSYCTLDPVYRKYHHDKVTFSMVYAFSENFILPISHDEVVHGKKSLLDKMWGNYEQKFSCCKAFFTYMMTHPGKKLTFMGCEIGQFKEWDYKESIEWFLLDYPMHKAFQSFVRALNHIYLTCPALYENDYSWEGFEWISADNKNQSVISYRRIDKQGNDAIAVINFTPVERKDFVLSVPKKGFYKELINSNSTLYGGSGKTNRTLIKSRKNNRNDNFIKITLASFGGCIFTQIKSRACRQRSAFKCYKTKSLVGEGDKNNV